MTKENNIDLVAVEELSFEAALKELEQIVTQLDQGDVALEQSITIYERGEALKKRCSQLLQAAEAKVSEIKFDSDNKAQIGNDLDDEIVF